MAVLPGSHRLAEDVCHGPLCLLTALAPQLLLYGAQALFEGGPRLGLVVGPSFGGGCWEHGSKRANASPCSARLMEHAVILDFCGTAALVAWCLDRVATLCLLWNAACKLSPYVR